MADKFVIVVHAGLGELAKAIHALLYGQELHEAGYRVQILFDGAGTTWVKEFEKPDNKLNITPSTNTYKNSESFLELVSTVRMHLV